MSQQSTVLTGEQADQVLGRNSLMGDAVVPFDTITNLTDDLSSAGQSIAFRSLANSALFQAINAFADYNAALLDPNSDDLRTQSLKQRAYRNGQVYAYFQAEAATHAETRYDIAMDFADMFDFICKTAPKLPADTDENYDAKFLKSIGLTKAQAIQIDAVQHELELALFQTRVDTITASRTSLQQDIEGVDIGTPDIPAGTAYKMLQKLDLKFSNELLRLYAKRAKIPGAMSKMVCITGDMPLIAKAIKALKNQFKGDDRVRFED